MPGIELDYCVDAAFYTGSFELLLDRIGGQPGLQVRGDARVSAHEGGFELLERSRVHMGIIARADR
jgi:hypothetical protein